MNKKGIKAKVFVIAILLIAMSCFYFYRKNKIGDNWLETDKLTNRYVVHYNEKTYYEIDEIPSGGFGGLWEPAGLLISGKNDISSYFMPDYFKPYVMVLIDENGNYNEGYICAKIGETRYYFKLSEE